MIINYLKRHFVYTWENRYWCPPFCKILRPCCCSISRPSTRFFNVELWPILKHKHVWKIHGKLGFNTLSTKELAERLHYRMWKITIPTKQYKWLSVFHSFYLHFNLTKYFFTWLGLCSLNPSVCLLNWIGGRDREATTSQ